MRAKRAGYDVVHVSSAHRTSDVRIHLREAASLARHGYRVMLIANRHQVELPETGVEVIATDPLSGLKRVTFGSARAAWMAFKSGASVVHLHDPELTWTIPLFRAAGRKVVYDAHEDLPEQVRSKPYLRSFTLPPALLAAHVAVWLASRSNLVVAATEQIATRFPGERTILVRNYPILREHDAGTPLLERTQAVAYVGVIAEQRGFTPMIEALADPQFPAGWRAAVAGPIASESYADALRELPGWRAVDYSGFLSTDAARDLLNSAQVGIVTLRRTTAYLDSLPTKMFEYFAAGMPVIASDFPLWRTIVEKHDCGILVDEESPSAIATAVARYAADEDLLLRHGRNARQAALGELNWPHEETCLLAGYREMLKQEMGR